MQNTESQPATEVEQQIDTSTTTNNGLSAQAAQNQQEVERGVNALQQHHESLAKRLEASKALVERIKKNRKDAYTEFMQRRQLKTQQRKERQQQVQAEKTNQSEESTNNIQQVQTTTHQPAKEIQRTPNAITKVHQVPNQYQQMMSGKGKWQSRFK